MRHLTDHRLTSCLRKTSYLLSMAGMALATSAQAATPERVSANTSTDSVIGIVSHADGVVKTVLLLLVLASITSWALWFVKGRELRTAKVALRADIAKLTGAQALSQVDAHDRATIDMLKMAAAELARSGPSPTHRMLEGVEDRVGAQLGLVEAGAAHRILWGTNLLASIGSISPFVGLAGTVWGIMNSFLGIARSQSASLSVVAPGIAEALIATAVGLAAAIPAVLIYNNLTRSVAGYRRLLNEVSVLTACIVSREAEKRDVEAAAPRSTHATPALVS